MKILKLLIFIMFSQLIWGQNDVIFHQNIDLSIEQVTKDTLAFHLKNNNDVAIYVSPIAFDENQILIDSMDDDPFNMTMTVSYASREAAYEDKTIIEPNQSFTWKVDIASKMYLYDFKPDTTYHVYWQIGKVTSKSISYTYKSDIFEVPPIKAGLYWAGEDTLEIAVLNRRYIAQLTISPKYDDYLLITSPKGKEYKYRGIYDTNKDILMHTNHLKSWFIDVPTMFKRLKLSENDTYRIQYISNGLNVTSKPIHYPKKQK